MENLLFLGVPTLKHIRVMCMDTPLLYWPSFLQGRQFSSVAFAPVLVENFFQGRLLLKEKICSLERANAYLEEYSFLGERIQIHLDLSNLHLRYSRPSVARTLMARLPWLFRTRF